MTLLEWMEKIGTSRPEVMRALDISSGHLADLSTRRHWPSRAMMVRILELTGGAVTPNDFLDDGERKKFKLDKPPR